MAATDAAMQLLEEVQHDFGEGPCVVAFAEDRVVAVQDLRSELVWDRIAVVVRQLQVRGVLSVPVRLADQPRAWTPAEIQALGGAGPGVLAQAGRGRPGGCPRGAAGAGRGQGAG